MGRYLRNVQQNEPLSVGVGLSVHWCLSGGLTGSAAKTNAAALFVDTLSQELMNELRGLNSKWGINVCAYIFVCKITLIKK